MIYRIIVFLVIVITAITYIVISKRKYKRLLKKEMEDIQNRNRIRREMEDREITIVGRGYTRTTLDGFYPNLNLDEGVVINESNYYDESQINAIIENASNFKRLKLNFKPKKHIKRHSIR